MDDPTKTIEFITVSEIWKKDVYKPVYLQHFL